MGTVRAYVCTKPLSFCGILSIGNGLQPVSAEYVQRRSGSARREGNGAFFVKRRAASVTR
ncbi:MAG: hypothetical protein LBG87_08660 [Spirochaetaceae bacterium]|nr:hypothetical protein [Spirochaetaceae bacterium]